MVNKLRDHINDYKKNHPDMTQVDIARAADVDPATLSRYANGHMNSINLDVWLKLSHLFGVPGSEIFEINLDDE